MLNAASSTVKLRMHLEGVLEVLASSQELEV